ncbi:MAG: hypothetical protein ONB48_06690 [candidate division KSB1 bacterium]|nr:hypothetical protein [candidate division KSB1 bacterium]MDZ7273228.1 hypothetical protein [candidate division KSB1 bacterium]MDZ7285330.1 hypothetical protein [candidate division KSB1 bacterium]MDZ7298362.1 hypothetical protein [candidate division KSB1 bacterium]MDZ7309255.1 hypothetical protein [candidate division KSB1 bacterium]
MSSFRILMYCNESLGWQHISRTVAIASSLANALPECSILVLTDLSTIGRFKLAERVDYVHLPTLTHDFHSGPASTGLHIALEHTLKIRRKIAHSAIKTFRPDIVLLDESLLNLPQELQRITTHLREELPEAKLVWGLSDTLGEPEFVKRQLRRSEVLKTFEDFADEIFVFGARSVFDLAAAYDLPPHLADKLFYTGYLSRTTPAARRVRAEMANRNRSLPLVLLAPGGSSDDCAMVDAYLRFLESTAGELALQSLIAAGPAISARAKREFAARAQRLPNVALQRFSKHKLQYVRFADLVICSGSYNILCEVLAHRKLTLVVPSLREQPGNLCRARLFQERDWVTVIQPVEFHPSVLREILPQLLLRGPRLVPRSRYDNVPLNGFASIAERVRALAGRVATEHMLAVS